LCSQTLKTLQQLVSCGVREDQAGRYHALGLGLVAPDLLIKSGVCKRYRDVTVYAADASHFVGEGSSSGGFGGDVIGGVSMMSSLLFA
jgi:hypothetical protein